MLIKHSALIHTLAKGLKPVYLIFGNDEYLLNEACHTIKEQFQKQTTITCQSLELNTQADWYELIDQANSFGLFAEHTLIEARFNKKTLDKTTQKILESYLNAANEQTLIIIRAPLMTYKSVSHLATLNHLLIVQINQLNNNEQLLWIKNQLKIKNILVDDDVPNEILHYTQGNLLASAQSIERLSLLAKPNTYFKRQDIGQQLIDQREYEVQELVESCLKGESEKVLRILEQAEHGKGEHVLILWLLMQTLRQLTALGHPASSHIPFSKRCASLNIWPSRENLYRNALLRIDTMQLNRLLQACHRIDLHIKTNQGNIKSDLSALALSICLGKDMLYGL